MSQAALPLVNCLHCFANVVFLNNVGVSLLSKGSNREAMATFQDAVSLVNVLVRLQEQPVLDASGATTLSSMVGAVERASKRLLDSTLHDSPASLPSTPIEVIRHDKWNTLSGLPISFSNPKTEDIGISQTDANSKKIHYAVRLEVTLADFHDEKELHLETAIIVYNFVLSHCLLAAQVKAARMSLVDCGVGGPLMLSPGNLQRRAMMLLTTTTAVITNIKCTHPDLAVEMGSLYVRLLTLDTQKSILSMCCRHTHSLLESTHRLHQEITQVVSAVHELEIVYHGVLTASIQAACAA
jgi:hypothetical protein